MVLLDGAMVATVDNKVIATHTLDQETGDAVIEMGTAYGIDPFVIGLKEDGVNESFLYPRRLNEHQKAVLKDYKDDPRLQFNPKNRSMPKNLKIVYFGEKEQLEPFAKNLHETFSSQIEIKLSPEKYGGGYFLTLLHPKGDKVHALEDVAAYLGKDITDFTVFGDSLNDVKMFQKAGTSVAVANALDEVKAAADIVLEHSNDEDAVAKYLKSQ